MHGAPFAPVPRPPSRGRTAPPPVVSITTIGRRNDPEQTKADILEVATRVFSERGFDGAPVREIAERTKTCKRMIYYYFGSKDGLYREVLLNHYRKLRTAELALKLDDRPALDALRRLVHFTYDWRLSHCDDIRLVMIENIHRARHLHGPSTAEPIEGGVSLVGDILRRGAEEGVFRSGIDATDLYLSMVSLCFFSISNRGTIDTIFGYDMCSGPAVAARRQSITQTVLRSVVLDFALLESIPA